MRLAARFFPALSALSLAVSALCLDPQLPVFRADLRVVVLQATVRSKSGEMVTDLKSDAFTVFEDGKRQTVTLFNRDDVPVSLGIAIDNSGSMRLKRASVEAAALAFVRASNPHDEVFVLNFGDKVRMDVPFTADLSRLEAGIARVDSIGGTAMRDAVEAGAAWLDGHATRQRKALLVITDGIDNASVATAQAIRAHALRGGITIHAIGLLADEPEARAHRARHDLDDLVESTGGVALYPATLSQVEETALDLARQIRNQYTLGYAPIKQELDGTYRKVWVSVRGDGFKVRTRPGYLASATLIANH